MLLFISVKSRGVFIEIPLSLLRPQGSSHGGKLALLSLSNVSDTSSVSVCSFTYSIPGVEDNIL